MGQSRPLFHLFSSFSHSNINFNNTNWEKKIWCARYSNPGQQDGRSRQNHGAMTVAPLFAFVNMIGQAESALTVDLLA